MKGFIEVTEVGGRNVMVHVGKIMSVLQGTDGTFIETGTDNKGVSIGILVRESYAEIKQKISEV